MRRWVALCTALLMTIGLATATAPSANAAGNDDPANAEVIAPNDDRVSFTSSNELSTPASDCAEDRPTEWFTFAPDNGGYWWLSSPRASAIDVYTGSSDSLTRYGCGSATVAGGGSRGATSLIIDLNASTTYYIAVNVGRTTSGSLGLRLLDDPAGATSVPLGDGPTAPAIDVGGVFVPEEMDVSDQVSFLLAFDDADAARMALTEVALVRDGRTCRTVDAKASFTVVDASGRMYAKRYSADPRFDHDHPCDADGQMDGGNYDVRLSARRTPTSPWVRATLTDVDVTGPANELRITTTTARKAEIVDYDHKVDIVTLIGEAQERWTDGVWRTIGAGVVHPSEVVAEQSTDGGTTWVKRTATPEHGDWYGSGRDVEADVTPHSSGLWRLRVPGQALTPTPDSLNVITGLSQYSIERVNFDDTSVFRGQNINISTQVLQRFSDGLWRGAAQAPAEVQFRFAGTKKWYKVGSGRVTNSHGSLTVNRIEVPGPGEWRVVVKGKASDPRFLRASNGRADHVSIAPPQQIRIGEPFVVPACMANDFGGCMSGETLLLQYYDNGWRTLDRERSGVTGIVKLRAPNGRRGVYRVASPTYAKSKSWRYT